MGRVVKHGSLSPALDIDRKSLYTIGGARGFVKTQTGRERKNAGFSTGIAGGGLKKRPDWVL
ncbi:MAG: hypothetical protein IJC73_07350 [Lentisphaeria bacterium]|nr:hypothetical protein [Lentisphaeria bacterium]